MKKRVKVSVKTKGYKIDFKTGTLIMNYKFAGEAEKYGSPEYRMIQAIKKDFPDIQMCVQSGREQKTARYNKRLTYSNMEKYIRCFDKSDILIKRFEKVKEMSVVLKSPYKFVCDWFNAQFPNYKEIPEFEGNLTVAKIVPLPDKDNYQVKKEKQAG
ncbi:MAG: hypothetical protein E7536_07215 [Ruminococcaceae bacterium]|nr:hypothetical protein [Oscillospiraceae bacterium]